MPREYEPVVRLIGITEWIAEIAVEEEKVGRPRRNGQDK